MVPVNPVTTRFIVPPVPVPPTKSIFVYDPPSYPVPAAVNANPA